MRRLPDLHPELEDLREMYRRDVRRKKHYVYEHMRRLLSTIDSIPAADRGKLQDLKDTVEKFL